MRTEERNGKDVALVFCVRLSMMVVFDYDTIPAKLSKSSRILPNLEGGRKVS